MYCHDVCGLGNLGGGTELVNPDGYCQRSGAAGVRLTLFHGLRQGITSRLIQDLASFLRKMQGVFGIEVYLGFPVLGKSTEKHRKKIGIAAREVSRTVDSVPSVGS